MKEERYNILISKEIPLLFSKILKNYCDKKPENNTTTELAKSLDKGIAVTNQQLTALLNKGIVTKARSGKTVIYVPQIAILASLFAHVICWNIKNSLEHSAMTKESNKIGWKDGQLFYFKQIEAILQTNEVVIRNYFLGAEFDPHTLIIPDVDYQAIILYSNEDMSKSFLGHIDSFCLLSMIATDTKTPDVDEPKRNALRLVTRLYVEVCYNAILKKISPNRQRLNIENALSDILEYQNYSVKNRNVL